MSVLGVVAVILLTSAGVSVPDGTRTLRDVLHDIGLSTREMRSVETGHPVAMVLKTDLPQEIAVFGSVRINVSADSFVKRFQDITRFESGRSVQQIGTFSQPPRLVDVESLRFPPEDLQALPHCEIGDCDLKLPAAVMARIRRELRRRPSDASAPAETILRDMLVTLVTAYRVGGNRALPELHDQQRPLATGQVLEDMLQKGGPILDSQPELGGYLRAYPRTRLADGKGFFYWSLVEFGIKPTLRVNHVTIYQPPPDRGISYAIASKQLYASHYFDGALELKLLLDVPRHGGPNSVYLLVVNRARIGGLTGLRGAFIRPSARRRTRDGLDRYLRTTKARLEQASGESVTR